MSYFADLTPHTYTPTGIFRMLNIGWLGLPEKFNRGESSSEFQDRLRLLCENRIHLHRGFHVCEFCPKTDLSREESLKWSKLGNGQIRVRGPDGIWYVAPTIIHHYVVEHHYLPPAGFIDAVLHPVEIGENRRG
jgi:hypothetical protein